MSVASRPEAPAARDGRAPRPPLWRDRDARAIFYQFLAIVGVLALAVVVVANTIANLETRGIRTGYGFLRSEAGFFIGETLIAYDASSTYGRAFVVGLLNTLYVSALGIAIATVLGVAVGIARLSSNWLVARLASVYVEVVRNVPLLLQLFFWYSLIGVALPAAREALHLLPGVYLSRSGLVFPVPAPAPIWPYVWAAAPVACGLAVAYNRWARARQDATGEPPPRLLPTVAILLGPPLLVWLAGGAPMALDVPEWQRFRFAGGSGVSPEFMALLAGLVVYTAGFIAEIVRAGILAVPWGQTEAAASIGLRRGLILRLVVLPQALRVIVPPMTSQYLNLTKNSSLAVAIGYPDLVSITNTSLNQTGQAIECISIMMAVYLTVSLSISAAMNLYNRSIVLVER